MLFIILSKYIVVFVIIRGRQSAQLQEAGEKLASLEAESALGLLIIIVICDFFKTYFMILVFLCYMFSLLFFFSPGYTSRPAASRSLHRYTAIPIRKCNRGSEL